MPGCTNCLRNTMIFIRIAVSFIWECLNTPITSSSLHLLHLPGPQPSTSFACRQTDTHYIVVIDACSGGGARGEGRLPTQRSCPAWEALVKLCQRDSLVTREWGQGVSFSLIDPETWIYKGWKRNCENLSLPSPLYFKSFLFLRKLPQETKPEASFDMNTWQVFNVKSIH